MIEEDENQNKVNYGDVLFTQSSETIEEIGMSAVYLSNREAYSNSFSFGFRFNREIDFKYIAYLFRSKSIRKKIMREGQGSTRINLSSNRVKEISIPIPSLEEQTKIGSFLEAIDKKIYLEKELIDNLKIKKNILIQKIFDREVRFKDDHGENYSEWKEMKVEDIFKESNYRMKDINNKSDYNELLSVTLYDGIKKQSELNYRDTSNADKSNYKIVNRFDIVYNSMRMWQGASGMSNYNGIVSSAYVVLRPLDNISPKFIEYLFKQKKSIYQFYTRSQGMTSDTLTLRYDLIKDITFLIPSVSEQNKIVDFLSVLDKKINLKKEQLKSDIEYKKGLMQRMLI